MDSFNSGGYEFETDVNISSDFDEEMAAFEAECARVLEQEHERQAKEERASEIAKAAEAAHEIATAEPEPEQQPEPEPEPQPEPQSKPQPEPEPEPEPASDARQEKRNKHRDELAAIMQAESDQSIRHEQASETNAGSDNPPAPAREETDNGLPGWLRMIFTVLLMILGGVGVYVMVFMDYHSYIFDPLCFIEIAICLLTAIGINASHIPFRVGKEIIMRLGAYVLFAYYIIYAADCLFLKRLLAFGIDKTNALAYARANISTDVIEGLTAMGNRGMLGCAMFVVPFAFMLLMLLKPFRNVLLYMLTMVVLFFAVGTMRILTMSGSFNLAQGCMVVTGAVAAYIIFVFPPLQRLISDAGLITWEYDDDDE